MRPLPLELSGKTREQHSRKTSLNNKFPQPNRFPAVVWTKLLKVVSFKHVSNTLLYKFH